MTETLSNATDIHQIVGSVAGVQNFWNYTPTQARLSIRLLRLQAQFFHKCARPEHLVIKPLRTQENWLVYFVFTPDGELTASHRFTLSRLKDSGLPLFIICAAKTPQQIPQELLAFSDALYWKGLSGYDFSAYTLALEAIALHAAHANVLLMNDSMFGPFVDLRPFLQQAPWDICGFTSSSLDENHLQSYAFIMRNVHVGTLQKLKTIFPTDFAYNNANYVIKCQELGLARMAAAQQMSAGAYWHADGVQVQDACLHKPFDLLEAGFPFMKKSLLGKFQVLQNPEVTRSWLARLGHP